MSTTVIHSWDPNDGITFERKCMKVDRIKKEIDSHKGYR